MPPRDTHKGGNDPHSASAQTAVKTPKLKAPPGKNPYVWIVHIRTGVTSAQRAGKGKGKSKVQPYDIIVHKGAVKHLVKGVLMDHDLAHLKDPQHTMIVLNTRRGDQVIWVAEDPFALVIIRAVDKKEPHSPFPWVPPAHSTVTKCIASGPPNEHKEPRRYKATFAIGNQLIDPDMVCNP